MIEDREVWQLNLKLLPSNPHGKARNKKKEFEFVSLTFLILSSSLVKISSFSSSRRVYSAACIKLTAHVEISLISQRWCMFFSIAQKTFTRNIFQI